MDVFINFYFFYFLGDWRIDIDNLLFIREDDDVCVYNLLCFGSLCFFIDLELDISILEGDIV